MIMLVVGCKMAPFLRIGCPLIIQVPDKLAIFHKMFCGNWYFRMAKSAEWLLLLVHLRL